MADQPILLAPVTHQLTEQHAVQAAQQAQPRLATAEEIRAADQLFAKQEQEAQFVAGLMGMYTGTLLLRDLAAEHLSHKQEEEEKAPAATDTTD